MARKIVLISLVVYLATWVRADCYPRCTGCTDVCTPHSGWNDSPSFGNCSQAKNCGIAANSSREYLDSGHPGLFTRVEQAGLVVADVIPASAADEAGIAVGDRILLLNGEDPVHSCTHQWPSAADPNSADLVLLHRGVRRQIQLPLVPVRQLLANGWSSHGHAMPVSIEPPAESDHKLWLFGLKWKAGSGSLEITDVLLGSPAARSGLAAGDEIIDVNGTPIQRVDVGLITSFLPTDHPTTTRITVVRGQSKRKVTLSSEGISFALRGLAHKIALRESSKPELMADTF